VLAAGRASDWGMGGARRKRQDVAASRVGKTAWHSSQCGATRTTSSCSGSHAGKSDADEPLTATPGFNAGAMVDRVLSDLGRYGGGLVLVIDDVHELAPTVQTHLTRLLAELPAQVNAVRPFLPTNLSGRRSPATSTSR
jgi:hypothetical protein